MFSAEPQSRRVICMFKLAFRGYFKIVPFGVELNFIQNECL